MCPLQAASRAAAGFERIATSSGGLMCVELSLVPTPREPLPFKAVATRAGTVLRERPVQSEAEGRAIIARWAAFAPEPDGS